MYEVKDSADCSVSPKITLQERLAVAKAYREAKAILDACPKAGYKLNTWGAAGRSENLKSIEMHIVEASLCSPELLALLEGRHRKAFREAMESHFGHPIPDSYFSNRLSKSYRDNLERIISEHGLSLKRSDYKALKDLLLALKAKVLVPVATEAKFPNGMTFSGTELTIGTKAFSYSLTIGRKPRVKWGQGRKAIPVLSLFELMVETYGEPHAGRPELFQSTGGP